MNYELIEIFMCELCSGVPISEDNEFYFSDNHYDLEIHDYELWIYQNKKIFLKMKIIGSTILFSDSIDLIEDKWFIKLMYSFWGHFNWVIPAKSILKERSNSYD